MKLKIFISLIFLLINNINPNKTKYNKVAVLYDIHGNFPALEAVIKEIQDESVDLIIIGGDVLLGPMPNECLKLLLEQKKPTVFIKGNCEDLVLDYSYEKKLPNYLPQSVLDDIIWTSKQLTESELYLINNWKNEFIIEIKKLGNIGFYHSTPTNNKTTITKKTSSEKIKTNFRNTHISTFVLGHTHMQFERFVDDIHLVNAGSVGMPFDKEGAHWIIIDENIQFRTSIYDRIKASETILNSNYPYSKNFIENYIIQIPDENEMLDMLTN